MQEYKFRLMQGFDGEGQMILGAHTFREYEQKVDALFEENDSTEMLHEVFGADNCLYLHSFPRKYWCRLEVNGKVKLNLRMMACTDGYIECTESVTKLLPLLAEI